MWQFLAGEAIGIRVEGGVAGGTGFVDRLRPNLTVVIGAGDDLLAGGLPEDERATTSVASTSMASRRRNPLRRPTVLLLSPESCGTVASLVRRQPGHRLLNSQAQREAKALLADNPFAERVDRLAA